MDLIPYSKVKIETKLSQTEVISRITEKTLVSNSFKFKLILKETAEIFAGKVFSDRFKIISYSIYTRKNMDRPIFNGKVFQKEKITEIEMKISPPIIGLIFTAIAFLVLAIIVLNQGLNEFILLIPIIIYLFLNFSFHSIRKEYLQKIYEIVEGETLIEL